MKITHKHPIARHGLIVGQAVNHNGITYDVIDELYDGYEIEPRKLPIWKKCHNHNF